MVSIETIGSSGRSGLPLANIQTAVNSVRVRAVSGCRRKSAHRFRRVPSSSDRGLGNASAARRRRFSRGHCRCNRWGAPRSCLPGGSRSTSPSAGRHLAAAAETAATLNMSTPATAEARQAPGFFMTRCAISSSSHPVLRANHRPVSRSCPWERRARHSFDNLVWQFRRRRNSMWNSRSCRPWIRRSTFPIPCRRPAARRRARWRRW